MIRVAVSGCAGRMGKTVVEAVSAAEDMEVVCGIDPHGAEAPFPVYPCVQDAVDIAQFDVLVDFTQPNVVAANLAVALPAGINCVVGTTGLSNDVLEKLAATATAGACLFYAPNFTTGAVLMMQFARAAAPYFPEAEVIEFHHANKLDAPSGTAVRTAQIIDEARNFHSTAPGSETEINGAEGARGALVEGVPVHSVRSMGFVASQEVIFGSMGQSLTIRHD
ncbi:MAG: 4-hydroxy-tetrahydrodipicolinate reductase, partial [Raoultibacter sp.]